MDEHVVEHLEDGDEVEEDGEEGLVDDGVVVDPHAAHGVDVDVGFVYGGHVVAEGGADLTIRCWILMQPLNKPIAHGPPVSFISPKEVNRTCDHSLTLTGHKSYYNQS